MYSSTSYIKEHPTTINHNQTNLWTEINSYERKNHSNQTNIINHTQTERNHIISIRTSYGSTREEERIPFLFENGGESGWDGPWRQEIGLSCEVTERIPSASRNQRYNFLLQRRRRDSIGWGSRWNEQSVETNPTRAPPVPKKMPAGVDGPISKVR